MLILFLSLFFLPIVTSDYSLECEKGHRVSGIRRAALKKGFVNSSPRTVQNTSCHLFISRTLLLLWRVRRKMKRRSLIFRILSSNSINEIHLQYRPRIPFHWLRENRLREDYGVHFSTMDSEVKNTVDFQILINIRCDGQLEGCTGSQWLGGVNIFEVENATKAVLWVNFPISNGERVCRMKSQ